MSAPPDFAIRAAIEQANKSPCAKSKRGVAIYSPFSGGVAGLGFNHQPRPFACDGSEACRASCSQLCVHAEAAAIRDAMSCGGLDLVHVKTVDEQLVPSGGPSCWQCSRSILDARIAGVWLFHEDGWRYYEPVGFHELSLKACGLPVLRGGHG